MPTPLPLTQKALNPVNTKTLNRKALNPESPKALTLKT